MKVHLLDGTYELFRHHFAVPEHITADGRQVGAVRAVVESVLNLLSDTDVTHLGVATDHVIESFRNTLYWGYKTGAGVAPELMSQFEPLEVALFALGVTVWPMVEFEADDALGAAAVQAAALPSVDQVVIMTPDKDLAQCVVGTRVVQFDRRKRQQLDESGVVEKFGVSPRSIPDYLAVVGDSSDGYPGLPGWGPKSAATVLARYEHLEHIPVDPSRWDITVRGAGSLAATLVAQLKDALLYRDLATLRLDAITLDLDAMRWTGPRPELEQLAETLDAPQIWTRALALRKRKAGAGTTAPTAASNEH